MCEIRTHAQFFASLPDCGVNCLFSRFIDNVKALVRRQIFLSLLNLNIFLKNLTPGKFAYIGQSERVAIIALRFQTKTLLSDVCAAIAVVVS